MPGERTRQRQVPARHMSDNPPPVTATIPRGSPTADQLSPSPASAQESLRSALTMLEYPPDAVQTVQVVPDRGGVPAVAARFTPEHAELVAVLLTQAYSQGRA